MAIKPYIVPVKQLVEIVRHPITALPEGFTHVKRFEYNLGYDICNVVTDGKEFVGCVSNDDKVAFDMKHMPILCLGYWFPTLAEVEKHFLTKLTHTEEQQTETRYVRRKDSPTGIKLNPNWSQKKRYNGLVFKNVDTGEEVPIEVSMKHMYRKFGISQDSGNALLYDGKIVNGWYILRIDGTANQQRTLVKGAVTIGTNYPITLLCQLSGLNRKGVRRLLNGEAAEVDGWKVAQVDSAAV